MFQLNGQKVSVQTDPMAELHTHLAVNHAHRSIVVKVKVKQFHYRP
jgi:hypothetical protein